MGDLSTATVDVRDMLCAQALAVVAQAAAQLLHDGWLDVTYSAEDVRRDLLAWAHDRAWIVREPSGGILRLQRP